MLVLIIIMRMEVQQLVVWLGGHKNDNNNEEAITVGPKNLSKNSQAPRETA